MANQVSDLSTAHWRKSSYSNGSGGNCVEVSDSHPGVLPVRDSKRAEDSPALLFQPSVWTAFLGSLKG